MEYTLIFPHQLFQNHPALHKNRTCVFIEDTLFFGDTEYPISFHVQKLVLHRATMKHHAAHLETLGYTVQYIEYDGRSTTRSVIRNLCSRGDSIHIARVCDDVLEQRIIEGSNEHDVSIEWYDSPNFYNTIIDNEEYFNEHQFFHKPFYEWQRKRHNILLDTDNNPKGGRWSFDTENRKKLPKDIEIPETIQDNTHDAVVEAKEYIAEQFPHAPGSIETFHWPVTRRQALHAMKEFFETRFQSFGDYQDAMTDKSHTNFHSLISSSLNCGLLNPQEIVKEAVSYGEENNIPISSVEGFIRQIVGWREYIRALYMLQGRKQRTTNTFHFTSTLPDAFWNATTGIEPFDDALQHVLDTGYAHHIERLMIFGNVMLLCEIDPDEVYKWFMALFIDAYDWVMVPNVYGMSQYADGGMMVTKPYVSSSNYIRKMSDYPRGDWCDTWDGLYWRWIDTHKKHFAGNPRMSMMLRQLEKMDALKKRTHTRNANTFLEKIGLV